MTAEVYGMRSVRKFIPVLARGTWQDAVPSWLKGKYGIDLTNQSKFKSGYNDLLTTIHGTREKAPRVGQKALRSVVALPDTLQPDDPIRILGVIIDEVTEPRLDGTRGSALYRIPFRLSRHPTRLWSELFSQAWERPPTWTTMHRPGIASVTGDKVILDGTTIEEVEKYHRDTLVLCINVANQEERQVIERRRIEEEARQKDADEHRSRINEISRRLKFD